MPIFDLRQTCKILLIESSWIWNFTATRLLYLFALNIWKASEILKMLKEWSLKETGISFGQNVFYRQSHAKYPANSKKIRQNWTRRSNFDISLVVIFDRRCQNLFGGRHWVLGFIQKQFWDFYHNIFYFPMILGLKLSGDSWGNFYTKILY